jgi:hypothetical protein
MDGNTFLLLTRLSRRLSSESLTRENFLQEVHTIERLELIPTQLEKQILALSITDSELKGLLSDLQNQFTLWLIANLPDTWVEEILQQNRLLELFPIKQVISLKAVRESGDFLVALNKSKSLERGSTLIVDRNALRANQTIRRGWDVAIYVDPVRLRRDLALWNILPSGEV